jgi:hypothetical protein
MPRTLQPIILGGTIDGFHGLNEGEKYKIIPFGLVKRGVISREYADWLFENEPLANGVILVVAVEGEQILKRRAAEDFAFTQPVDGDFDPDDTLKELEPRRHPNAD